MYKVSNLFWVQLRIIRNIIIRVILPTTLFLLLLQVISFTQHIPFYNFVADINEIAGLPPYVGMVSTIGILFWCAAAVVCLFSAYILKKCGFRERTGINYLLFLGYFNLLLLSDDLFQIHEYYFTPFININLFDNPKLVQNLFEGIFFLIYIVLLAIGWLRFNSFFKKTQYYILILSILFFGLSTAVDLLLPERMRFHFLLEEGSKLLGIITWFIYCANCGYQQIQQMHSSILNVAYNYPSNERANIDSIN